MEYLPPQGELALVCPLPQRQLVLLCPHRLVHMLQTRDKQTRRWAALSVRAPWHAVHARSHVVRVAWSCLPVSWARGLLSAQAG